MTTLPADAGADARRPWSRTEKQWSMSLLVTLGLVGLFAAIYAMERAVAPGLHRDDRFVREASETITRFLAIAHTVVATSFLLTSRKMRRKGAVPMFLGCAVLGVLTCLGFHALGGMRAALGGALFYTYFVAHELRDEGYLTGLNGDAGPVAPPEHARFLAWAPVATVVLLILAIGAAGITFGGAARKIAKAFDWLSPAGRTTLGAASLAIFVSAIAFIVTRAARVEGTTIVGHFRRRRPRFFVTVGFLGVLLLGPVLTGRIYLIVALHVVWWAVFSYAAIRRAPRPAQAPRAGSWAWVKSTPTGFASFHAAVLLVVVGIAAVHAFYAHNTSTWPVAKVLAGRDAFPYWTLMHVSLSWMPRN